MTDTDLRPECIILMSGGMDSLVCAAYALKHYSTVHALTFSYGQRNPPEIDSAYNVSAALELQVHEPIQTAHQVLIGSSLVDFSKIPRYSSMKHFHDCQKEREEKGEDKPDPTFVPGRNTLFFNIAANRAYKLGITDILMGISASDSDFPDCNKDFLEKEVPPFYSFAITGKRDTFRCVLPLIELTKAQIILKGQELFEDNKQYNFEELLELTHTCYFPTRGGCDDLMCRACLFRSEGFKAAGIEDPIKKFRKSKQNRPITEELLS